MVDDTSKQSEKDDLFYSTWFEIAVFVSVSWRMANHNSNDADLLMYVANSGFL